VARAVSVETLEARLAMLVTADVAMLLAHVVPSVRAYIEMGDDEAADYLLTRWEQAFGRDVAVIAQSVESAQRTVGYRTALAGFSRVQRRRRDGLEQFHASLLHRSRRRMDRWRWVVIAYADDIARFLETRRCVVSVAETQRGLTRSRVRTLQRHRVLLAAYSRWQSVVAMDELVAPAVQARAVERMDTLLVEAQSLELARERDLARRDEIRSETIAALGKLLDEASISRLPSIAAQVEAYRHARVQVDRDRRVEETKRASSVLKSQMDELQELLDGMRA
jgi:hypothetical protein